MIWVGLTGGIGSGKTTVAKMIKSGGFSVVNADELAHKALGLGGAGYQPVIDHFGADVLTESGAVDRAKLAKKVFKDKRQLTALESILHPVVRLLAAEERAELEGSGQQMAFYDVPLLFEKNMQSQFDKTLLVFCEPEQQIQRVMLRNSITRAQVEERMANQIPLEQKKINADYVIENTFDEGELKTQVDNFLLKITKQTNNPS